eukprot:scaffold316322_cov44-Tisochrysis_lutea.AAC.1
MGGGWWVVVRCTLCLVLFTVYAVYSYSSTLSSKSLVVFTRWLVVVVWAPTNDFTAGVIAGYNKIWLRRSLQRARFSSLD